MVAWFRNYSQYDNLFNFWVYIFIFEFILIYLNHLKLVIKKYQLFLQLITINSDLIFDDDDVGGQCQL
jgi:hypothetical protein